MQVQWGPASPHLRVTPSRFILHGVHLFHPIPSIESPILASHGLSQEMGYIPVFYPG